MELPRDRQGKFVEPDPHKCPWCGEIPEIEEVTGRSGGITRGRGLFFVQCCCGARGPEVESRIAARREWDRIA
jgi:hypothetical protein